MPSKITKSRIRLKLASSRGAARQKVNFRAKNEFFQLAESACEAGWEWGGGLVTL
jgi:hypothetical protein